MRYKVSYKVLVINYKLVTCPGIALGYPVVLHREVPRRVVLVHAPLWPVLPLRSNHARCSAPGRFLDC